MGSTVSVASNFILLKNGKKPEDATIDDVLAAIEELDKANRSGQGQYDWRAGVSAGWATGGETGRETGHEQVSAGELERKAAQLLEEVRHLSRTGRASGETLRATLVVLDGALDQVRRLLR